MYIITNKKGKKSIPVGFLFVIPIFEKKKDALKFAKKKFKEEDLKIVKTNLSGLKSELLLVF